MKIKTVGIAGLGLLGRGIASCFLGHGFRVIAFTRREATHEEAKGYIARAMADLVERAGFSRVLLDEWAGRYVAVTSLEAMGDCDFLIESVVEDMAAKQEVFDRLESLVSPDTVIASNTSALPISHLQQGRRHPERFLGMHWAEPAHATRFLEIIRGEQTSDEAFGVAERLAQKIGKEPSMVEKDVPAFIVNRIGYAMYREALHVLEMGVADVETIDRSVRNALGLWATMCGPFRWMDLTGGPALYGKAIEGVLPSLSNATELPEAMQALREADARGVANGHGFYEYTDEEVREWEERFREHAWTVRELMNRYFPLDAS